MNIKIIKYVFLAHLQLSSHNILVEKMIQVDIGSHPPFSTGSKQFSGNFANLLFLAVFNFWGHFEGLNEGFSGLSFSMITKGSDLAPKINLLDDTFPTGYHTPKMQIICKSYDHGKFMY